MGDTVQALLALRRFVDENPDMAAHEVATEFINRVKGADLRWFAWMGIKECADGILRAQVRHIELKACQAEQPVTPVALSRDEVFDQVKSDPSKSFTMSKYYRTKFRQWMGDEFDSWYSDALRNSPNHEARQDLIWKFEGWEATETGKQSQWQLRQTLSLAVKEYTEFMRLKITRELLASTFALGDGSIVTWGEATVQQHQQRIELLMGNAAGNIETAARHNAAIRMIEEAGAARLSDLHQSGCEE